jgi:FAD/FMN-containing dehydrogenase
MSHQSWGRIPKVQQTVETILWKEEIAHVIDSHSNILPYGKGRSYGDSCLNDGNTIADLSNLNRFISFDAEQGILQCETGVTFAEIIDTFLPKGWFLPVTPGTKYVTVGGAIANDVHGKNHHVEGTIGHHIQSLTLLRSDGQMKTCSQTENEELFRATIGGLGLTGFILIATIKLKKVTNEYFAFESIKFKGIDDFFTINEESEKNFDYTVSWIDCSSTGKKLGRGIYMRGNHSTTQHPPLPFKKPSLKFPIEAPTWLLNETAIKAFNFLYYHKQLSTFVKKEVPYNPFFYPLDFILEWNKMYGSVGFYQFQCVIPFGDERSGIKKLLSTIAESGKASFLAVLKTFGTKPSVGMMSFPSPGVTLALDFRNDGESTVRLLHKLEEIVASYNGKMYPAKDATMRPKYFQQFYPQWEEFSQFKDPKISSSFWRRVTNQ